MKLIALALSLVPTLLPATEPAPAAAAAASAEALAPGRTDGPGIIHTRVLANSRDVYEIEFRGRRSARIDVRGDGDTDLDLYVYDEFGNLVASDLGLTDRCHVSWRPSWTGEFTVVVVNLGSVYNAYTMETN